MRPPGRPKGEYRSAQREGTPMRPAGDAVSRQGNERPVQRPTVGGARSDAEGTPPEMVR